MRKYSGDRPSFEAVQDWVVALEGKGWYVRVQLLLPGRGVSPAFVASAWPRHYQVGPSFKAEYETFRLTSAESGAGAALRAVAKLTTALEGIDVEEAEKKLRWEAWKHINP